MWTSNRLHFLQIFYITSILVRLALKAIWYISLSLSIPGPIVQPLNSRPPRGGSQARVLPRGQSRPRLWHRRLHHSTSQGTGIYTYYFDVSLSSCHWFILGQLASDQWPSWGVAALKSASERTTVMKDFSKTHRAASFIHMSKTIFFTIL